MRGPQLPLRVGTASSLQDSGLCAAVAAAFSARAQLERAATCVGMRDPVAAAKDGQVDLLWLQSRAHEDAFVADGYGINRRDIMYGEFVIVGPRSDPAGIGRADSAVHALGLLSDARARFVTRGDQSGAHLRERSLWKLARVEPDPAWYWSVDASMVPTLQRASELGAYALADLPTFLLYREGLELKIWVQGDPRLQSGYGAMAVNPLRVSGTDYAASMAFIEFLTSPPAQALIGEFGRERYGTSLFHPLAEPRSAD